jgi:hypothetical protein
MDGGLVDGLVGGSAFLFESKIPMTSDWKLLSLKRKLSCFLWFVWGRAIAMHLTWLMSRVDGAAVCSMVLDFGRLSLAEDRIVDNHSSLSPFPNEVRSRGQVRLSAMRCGGAGAYLSSVRQADSSSTLKRTRLHGFPNSESF